MRGVTSSAAWPGRTLPVIIFFFLLFVLYEERFTNSTVLAEMYTVFQSFKKSVLEITVYNRLLYVQYVV